ncbi:SR-related and CTD-associated factor 4b [Brachyhypopomus gauderio]|uniref:SR-related and CTD-associated factor 4b n=1 Tax=Brachyhypopomus gauderio TaxID=698409 RepID=UPI0040433233
MDAVKAFNTELLSLMDMKPPISRAKMMSITKAGIKAIKLYKHVVQIIEKFIKRCSPELKVPGLYVVDSIIRQSRHQFGEDKDVFGPRFLKNITMTFQSLYQCPPDDKAKILRVLELWQKNCVFSMDVIQPLLAMASGALTPVLENGSATEGSPATAVPVQPTQEAPAATDPIQTPAALAAIAQILQSAQSLDLQQVLQTLQQGVAPQSNTHPPTPNSTSTHQKSSIAKVLLDRFDYDEEPEVVEEPQQEETSSIINLPDLQQALQAHLISQLSSQVLPNVQAALQGLVDAHPAEPAPARQSLGGRPDAQDHGLTRTAEPVAVSMETEQPRSDAGDGQYTGQRRSPRRQSSSRSRRSRSGSRSRRTWSHRSRSRSREHWRGSPRSRVEEQRDRERKHRGLPTVKRETLSVCSTTLWIGQLDKKTQQQDISCLMEEFGQIESVNMIPPRGCAYVVMVHRQDAYTALNRLGRGSARINHKPFKIAWAMNKGITARFKKYWDVELGVAYIPWSRLKAAEIPALCEGGTLDQETIRAEWASLLTDLIKPSGGPEGEQADGAAHAVAGPQVPPLGIDAVGRTPGRPSPSRPLPLAGFNPAHMSPADLLDGPSLDAAEGPQSRTGLAAAPLVGVPCAGVFVGPQAGPPPLQQPPRPLPPFMPPFPNNMPPPNMPPLNMPHLNMPPVNMPQGPVFREGPPGRFRIPMPGPYEEDFHSSRDFPPPGPPLGPMDEDHWEVGPFRDDWRDYGPNRGPELFGEEPPFRRGGWSRGGPRGHGRFGNR